MAGLQGLLQGFADAFKPRATVEREQMEAAQGLLDSDRAALRGLQQVYRTGNQEGAGLLSDGTLPPQYYERAGIIDPQYGYNAQNNAAAWREQGLRGEQAMAREQASLAQRQAEVLQQQAQYDQTRQDTIDWRDRQHNTLSAYESQQANQAIADNYAPPPTMAELYKINTGNLPPAEYYSPDGKTLALSPGGGKYNDAMKIVSDLETSDKLYTDQIDYIGRKGAFGNDPEALALDARIGTDIGPTYAYIKNTGAENVSDSDMIEDKWSHRLNDIAGSTLGHYGQILGAANYRDEALETLKAARSRVRIASEEAYRRLGMEPPKYPEDKAYDGTPPLDPAPTTYKTAQERLRDLDILQNGPIEE